MAGGGTPGRGSHVPPRGGFLGSIGSCAVVTLAHLYTPHRAQASPRAAGRPRDGLPPCFSYTRAGRWSRDAVPVRLDRATVHPWVRGHGSRHRTTRSGRTSSVGSTTRRCRGASASRDSARWQPGNAEQPVGLGLTRKCSKRWCWPCSQATRTGPKSRAYCRNSPRYSKVSTRPTTPRSPTRRSKRSSYLGSSRVRLAR